jgi:hypothetical protein
MVRGYKTELRRLHPFEKVVADLTVRARQKKDGLTLMAILVSSGVVSDNIVVARFVFTDSKMAHG